MVTHGNKKKGIGRYTVDLNYFRFLFLTSSSLHRWSINLFGWPGTMPECPFDQSYETAYAKMLPVRLNAVVAIGPG